MWKFSSVLFIFIMLHSLQNVIFWKTFFFFKYTFWEERTSLASPTIVSQQASDTRCGRNFSHTSSKNQFCHGHQLSFSNSIQFWQHLLEDSVRSHRLRAQSYKTAPHLGCQLQTPGCFVCAAGWPSLSSIALGFINLLERLAQLCQHLLRFPGLS